MCSAGPTRYAPNKMSVRNAKVMLTQMNAMLALIHEDETAAENYFREATNLESQAEYAYGPPDVVYPSFEQYGYWLLEQDRAEDALEQFNKSLKRAPGRAMALRGKIKALNELGRVGEMQVAKEELNMFWKPTKPVV